LLLSVAKGVDVRVIGKDGKTPAMRLGLAKGVVGLEDIIYF
jgi:hypothetical protein